MTRRDPSPSFDKLRMRLRVLNGLDLMVSLSNHGPQIRLIFGRDRTYSLNAILESIDPKGSHEKAPHIRDFCQPPARRGGK